MFVIWLLLSGRTTREFLSKGDSQRRFGSSFKERAEYRLGTSAGWWRLLVPFAPAGIVLREIPC
jgi:hypothetical protein